jgi:hypothetical protein
LLTGGIRSGINGLAGGYDVLTAKDNQPTLAAAIPSEIAALEAAAVAKREPSKPRLLSIISWPVGVVQCPKRPAPTTRAIPFVSLHQIRRVAIQVRRVAEGGTASESPAEKAGKREASIHCRLFTQMAATARPEMGNVLNVGNGGIWGVTVALDGHH